MRYTLLLASFVVLLTACPSESAKHSSTPDLASATDLAPDSTPTALVVPATNDKKPLSFSFAATGAGTARVGAITLDKNQGQVVLDGKTLPAFSYLQQPWEPVYTLYQTLLVDDDAWYLMWLYCEGDELTHVYFEGTNGTLLADEKASGSCAAIKESNEVAVALPTSTLQVEPNHAFTIEGDRLSLTKDGRGTVQLGTKRYDLFPFEVVDCLDCAAEGWLELHAVFAPPEGGAAGTMIFYFYASKPTEILGTYGLELPSLKDPVGQRKFTATWAYEPPMARRVGPPPLARAWPLRPPRE